MLYMCLVSDPVQKAVQEEKGIEDESSIFEERRMKEKKMSIFELGDQIFSSLYVLYVTLLYASTSTSSSSSS